MINLVKRLLATILIINTINVMAMDAKKSHSSVKEQVLQKLDAHEHKAIDKMVSIRTCLDPALFAGKIVIYQAQHYYFTQGGDAYVVTDDQSLRAGYIPEGYVGWYNLSRLLKTNGFIESNCALVESLFKSHENGMISMREANASELKRIKIAIDNGHAKFNYMNWHQEAIKKALYCDTIT